MAADVVSFKKPLNADSLCSVYILESWNFQEFASKVYQQFSNGPFFESSSSSTWILLTK